VQFHFCSSYPYYCVVSLVRRFPIKEVWSSKSSHKVHNYAVKPEFYVSVGTGESKINEMKM
jgi:hypothetical protein